MKHCIRVENVSLQEKEKKQKILTQVNLEIAQGELVGIIGESGSGKTTLLNCISGFLDKKRFLLEGNIEYVTQENKISFILQDSIRALNPYEKVGEQLLETYIFHHRKRRKEEAKEEIEGILRKIGFYEISRIWKAYPSELSGGMKQRIAIALCLCCDTNILLADEPTTALDIVNQYRFIQVLKQVCVDRKITLLYVSHDIRILMQLCNRIIVMYEGKIIEDGSVDIVWDRPKHPYTKILIEEVKKHL